MLILPAATAVKLPSILHVNKLLLCWKDLLVFRSIYKVRRAGLN